MFTVGLNPYGLAYTLGIYGAGTPRASPRPWTVPQYVAFAESLHVRGIELHTPHLQPLSNDTLRQLRDRFAANDWWIVLARPLWTDDWPRTIEIAKLLGARTIRMHLTPLLCGDRTGNPTPWTDLVAQTRRTLEHVANQLADHGLQAAIENHQDFGSAELLELCDLEPNIGITLDTANPLATGEDPVGFARAVAPRILHLHLKDYQVQWTTEGYRLIRCPTGSGCIPFPAIGEVFKDKPLTASIEIGALDARHIKCLTPAWWTHHPERDAREFSKCLAAARCKPLNEHDDHRTPWEKTSPPEEITAYELEQVRQSAANLRALGWL